MAQMNPQALERFMEKVAFVPESGCWVWMAHVDSRGYGWFTPDGRGTQERAHRLSAMHFLGADVYRKEHVLHKCDVPACVNPAHLYVGSHHDNMRDAVNRDRFLSGKRAPWSKVNGHTEIERGIQKMAESGNSQAAIARAFGVSQATISRTLSRLN